MFSWAYINDEFIAERKAVLPVNDLSVLRGYGVFDFMRFRHFHPLFTDEHLDRLFFSMKGLGLKIEPGKQGLKEIIDELIQKNQVSQGGIRITVTGGSSENGYLPGKANLIITQTVFEVPSPEQYQNGICLSTYGYQRQLPEIKTIDYLMGIYLQPWIRSQGADEVLYVNQEQVTECPRSNIFIVDTFGQLCTPSANILKGITRNKVLELAAQHYTVKEKNIHLEEVYEAREVFITSTTKQILPVRSVNNHRIGKGDFPVSSHILELYQTKSSIPARG